MPPSVPQLDIVLFDVDDTLYSTTEFAKTARRQAIEAMVCAGLQVDVDAGVAELDEVVAEFTSNYPEHFARLLDRLGPRALGGHNPAVLMAAGVVAYHRTKERDLHMLPDAQAALERLSGAGVRLGVISAGLRVKQAEKLIRLDALRYLDPAAIFFSDQLGVGKPNPKIYTKTCALLGVKPERAMYVGDRPTHDTGPASSVGLKSVHYTGADGKYCSLRCVAPATHIIDDMRKLPDILANDYGMRV